MGFGEVTHQLTSRLTIWGAGYKVRSVKPLEPEEALKNGAELLGEGLVFFVGGAVVVWEYNSSKQKEKKKEQKRHDELQRDADELQHKFHILDVRLRAMEKVVKSHRDSIFHIGGARYEEPEETKDRSLDEPLHVSKSPSVALDEDKKNQKEKEEEGRSAKAAGMRQQISEQEKARSRGWWGWITSPFRRQGETTSENTISSTGNNAKKEDQK
jgi:hypothetical protein